jgi:3-hydroxyacyl-CoA dehydrogenase/enoyl-CoA hydratase/3-hydroxybutyryl-CoA epimerase
MKTKENSVKVESQVQKGLVQLRWMGDVAILDLADESKPINTFSKELLTQLDSQWTKAFSQPSLKGVVITSSRTSGFAAGVDISIFDTLVTQQDGQNASQMLHTLFAKFEHSAVPVVAAIHGVCLGGGLEMALACHRRVVTSDSSTSLGLPEIQLGLIPGGGGTQRLPRLIGLVPALDLILTGKKVDGKKALKLGLVDAVVPPNQLEERAVQWCLDNPISTSLSEASVGTSLWKKWNPMEISKELSKWNVSQAAQLVMEGNLVGRSLVKKKTLEQIEKNTKGHYPAPLKALDVVIKGMELKLEKGLELESQAFGELVITPESRALVHVFRTMTAAKKNPFSKGVQQQSKKNYLAPLTEGHGTVGVLGAGLMGSGVATVLAERKIRSLLLDRDGTGLAQGMKGIQSYFSDKLKKNRIKKHDFLRNLSYVNTTTDFATFKNSNVFIEAVFEEIQVKSEVIKKVETHTNVSQCIIATNTSSIPITQIAQKAKYPENVVGMHFFSPVPKMPLVEIIKGNRTSELALCVAFDLATKMGKNIVVVNDGPGFYTTRILAMYLLEAVQLVLEGNRIEDVDSALEKFGFPVGPLTLIDEVGIDVSSHIVQILAEAFPSVVQTPKGLDRILKDNRKGRKNAKGFYLYEQGKKQGPDDSIYTILRESSSPQKISDAKTIVDRCVLAFVNEAARCLDQKILNSPDDADLGAVFGLGFPPFLGGPLWYVQTLGKTVVKDHLNQLTKTCGPRFEPASYFNS